MNLLVILNVCATEDAQISWAVRADSLSQTCTVSQLSILMDDILGFIFISVESQVKGLACPPDPRQSPAVPYPVLNCGSWIPSPEPVTTLP